MAYSMNQSDGVAETLSPGQNAAIRRNFDWRATRGPEAENRLV